MVDKPTARWADLVKCEKRGCYFPRQPGHRYCARHVRLHGDAAFFAVLAIICALGVLLLSC